MPTLFTVGYGRRGIDEFVELLQRYQVAYLVDIRSHPYSSYKPEFSRDSLEDTLRQHSIRYIFMGDTLGGQPEDKSCYVNGKVDYTVVRGKEFYMAGVARLRKAWEKQLPVVIMCSEGKPEECHRSKLVGRTLLDMGIDVEHIDENGDLLSEEEVLARLTHGQQSFLDPTFTSRKKYVEDK